MSISGLRMIGILALGLAAGAPVLAAQSAFSGFWSLSRRTASAPPELTSAGKAQQAQFKLNGEALADDLLWCVDQGLPFDMDQAGPIDIIVDRQEFFISPDVLAIPRHIYIAGQKHPDPDGYDPTVVGYSFGSLKGNTLTATTVGLLDGVGPAGIPRTGTAKVQEIFKVSGDLLTVATTWSDPKVLRKPYRYTLQFHRLPKDYAPPEYYCDARSHGMRLPGH